MKLNKKILGFVFSCAALSAILYVSYTKKPVQYLRNWLSQDTVELTSSRFSVRDLGEGSPSVVIVPGVACTMDQYRNLQDMIARQTRVVSYDRAGLGRSEDNANPKTLDYIVRDLAELLVAQDVPPPYVLIGHSFGGQIIRYFAQQYPTQVDGLIFLEHPHEDWFNYVRMNWMPEESSAYFKFWTPEYDARNAGRVEELLAYESNCDMVRGIAINPETPVLMFTGNNIHHFRKTQPGRDLDQKRWAEMQAELLVGVVDARQIVDWETGHWPQNDKPEMVFHEILDFIDRLDFD